MTNEEWHICERMATSDEDFNGTRETASEFIDLIIQCYEVFKRC